MSKLFLCCGLLLVALMMSPCVPSACEGGYGSPLSSFQGIVAYSNGDANNCTGTGSGTYQCVEFVKRFYANEVENPLSSLGGNPGYAYQGFGIWHDNDGLTQYVDGQTTVPPAPGDIYCQSGHTYGHVGVVKSVNLNTMKVVIIDQNRHPSSAELERNLSIDGQGRYSIQSIGTGFTTQGWLRDPNYIPSGVDAKFTDVVNRNGGSTAVGNPSGNYYWHGPYVRRNYTGGSFGACCILYDPNNGLGNPQATNEAYLLRTGFYQHYVDSGGWQAYGCPSRDEYHPESGAPNDAIQFFVRRVGGVTQFHYMYYEAALQVGHQISWHSQYTTDWVSQTPGGKVGMLPNETRTFTVRFQNTGTTTWYNNPTTYPYDYISLKSTDPDGNAATSLLYGSGLGWIDAETPCTMQEASVAPGGTATFTFTGKVASGQSPGLMLVYFRPQHSMAGLLDDWGGMHFQVNVVAPVTANGAADITVLYNYGTNPCQTRAHLLLSATDTLIYQGDNGWRVLDDYCLPSVVRSLPGDFDGNGVADLAMLYQYGECSVALHVLLSTGVSFDYAPYWWQSTGYCVSAIQGMTSGDFNGDDKDDIAVVYDYGNCETRLHVMLSNGAGFDGAAPAGWWAAQGWYCADQVKFVNAGDYNGDGKADLALAYSYGVNSTALHVFLSTGSAFTYQGNTWFYADGWFGLGAMKFMESGDINGDGKTDVVMACRYGADETALLGFVSQGSSFWYQGWWWHVTYFSLDAAPYMQVGDLTGDGKADVAIAYRYGEYNSAIHGFASTGTAFTYQPYWWQHTSYGWDYTTSFAIGRFDWNGGSPKVAAGETDHLPRTFRLSQNYPNPFNPATTIAYTLPSETHVTLDVFNILGQKVTTLVDEHQAAGAHVTSWDASRNASGVYLYRITTGETTETKKMLLLK